MFTKDEIEVCRTCDLPCAISAGCPLVHTWHTGTPTEEGWYLQRIKSKNKISYDTDYYENGDWKYSCVFREIVAWQKIEEGEEVNG